MASESNAETPAATNATVAASSSSGWTFNFVKGAAECAIVRQRLVYNGRILEDNERPLNSNSSSSSKKQKQTVTAATAAASTTPRAATTAAVVAPTRLSPAAPVPWALRAERRRQALERRMEAYASQAPAKISSSSSSVNAKWRRRDAAAEDEDEAYGKTARALLKKKRYDPEDVNKSNNHGCTPMIHFCGTGNFKMCQYLLSRGADCRKVDTKGNFPMVAAAAAARGHLEIVRFLSHDGGAHEDIRKLNKNGWSPLRTALYNDHGDTWKWLVLNEALSSSRAADGGIDDMIMRRDFCQVQGQGQVGDVWFDERRLALLSWAQDAVTTHDNFQLFLTGTSLFSRGDETSTTSLSLSASLLVRIFNGQQQPDLLELISQYVVEPRTQHQVRTLRQLVDRLPTFIAAAALKATSSSSNGKWIRTTNGWTESSSSAAEALRSSASSANGTTSDPVSPETVPVTAFETIPSPLRIKLCSNRCRASATASTSTTTKPSSMIRRERRGFGRRIVGSSRRPVLLASTSCTDIVSSLSPSLLESSQKASTKRKRPKETEE